MHNGITFHLLAQIADVRLPFFLSQIAGQPAAMERKVTLSLSLSSISPGKLAKRVIFSSARRLVISMLAQPVPPAAPPAPGLPEKRQKIHKIM